MHVVRKLCCDHSGHFIEACSCCFTQLPKQYSEKKKHKPFCKKDHQLNNSVLLFVKENKTGDDKYVHVPTTARKDQVHNHLHITKPIQNLFTNGFSKNDVISESRKVIQLKNKLKEPPPTFKNQLIPVTRLRQYNNGRGRTISTSPDSLDDMPSEEEFDGNYSSDIGDLRFNGDVDNPDEEEPDTYKKSAGDNLYYEVYSEKQIQEVLKESPDKFKVCIIHLDGAHKAWCTPVDLCETLQDIEIRGRFNCGPSMEGDTVVVHIVESEVRL